MEVQDQRIIIKFFVKSGKTGAEICNELKATLGESAMKPATIYKWVKRYQEGRESVEDDPREGRPSTSRNAENVKRIDQFLAADRRRVSTRQVAEALGMNRETVRIIITDDLKMRKLCCRVVPKVLTAEQKNTRVRVCEDWRDTDNEWLNRVITGDESWFYEYDPSNRRASMSWMKKNEPRVKKAKMSKSKIKSLLIVFFDRRGIVHKEFVPEGRTVNGAFYLEVLKRLQARVRRVRPELHRSKSWILHHDDAPAHSCILVRDWIAKNGIITIEHPPYSPDLAPCDFFLFPKIKKDMKDHHWGSRDEVEAVTTRSLQGVTSEEFDQCFKQWQHRWKKCIRLNGEYFEGDRVKNLD